LEGKKSNLDEVRATRAPEAATVQESQDQLQQKECESPYEQRVFSNDNIKSHVKAKRVSKVKMAEF
jgi:hypothetical protein